MKSFHQKILMRFCPHKERNLKLIILPIMFNKFNQPRAGPKSRVSYSRSLNANSKITVFVVHKMIEKIKEVDFNEQCPSHIFSSLSFNTPLYHSYEQQRQHNLVRQNLKTEHSHPRVDYIFKETRARSRWQGQASIEFDSKKNRKNQKSKNCKTISSDKSSNLNRYLVDKMKTLIQKTGKHQANSHVTLNEINFGLNIIQIKKLNNQGMQNQPKDRITVKRQLNIPASSKEQEKYSEEEDNDMKSNCQMSEAKQFAPFSPPTLKQDLFLQQSQVKEKGIIIKQIMETPNYKKQQSKRRMLQISSFQKKMFKMSECLDLILNSYHCKLRATEKEQQNKMSTINQMASNSIKLVNKKQRQRFFYFVGGGNNSNLIRSLFRKRSWWVQVDNITKANLVWTQLRMPSVLQKLKMHNDYNSVNDVIFYEEIYDQCSEQAGLLRSQCRNSTSTANSEISRVKESSLNQIFHEKQSKKYHMILDSKEAESHLQKIQTPEILHNHYEHNYMFGNKNALYYNLSNYYDFTRKNLDSIAPLTFYLQKGNKKLLDEFERAFNDLKRRNCIWILKPAENSNRGQGIEVTKSLNQIKNKLNNQKKLIVQYYMQNLLLYHYRKFDIRTYMFTLAINGRLKFFWYEEGYIRTSSEIYDLENLNDSFIHLTNDAIQKNGDNYGKYEEGNKLSYSEFQRYLEYRFPRESWSMCTLHQQMKQLAKEAIKATYCRIDPARRSFGLQLFGLDFIVDNQFKPYLIEINTNPCLQLCSPVLERLIPRMMENLFRMSVDPIFRPGVDYGYSKCESYYMYDETFLDRNKFTLLFDQKYDRDFEWEERCKKMRGLEWSHQEQEQYSDQGRIIVVDY